MPQLWSSDRRGLPHSSFGGQVTMESCSFQTNMLPLSLLPQRRDSEGPHSLTSSRQYTRVCLHQCVCMWMFEEGKSSVCLLDLSLFIDCESLSLTPVHLVR